MISRTIYYRIILITIIGFSSCFLSAKNDKPNIIVILVDDMGYSDLGCTGSEIKTPNLDKMASEGVLFTHFYNASRCCPSRASLLTGQYQWDAGIGHMDYTKSELPEYQGYLNNQSITIAEALKDNGYQTFMSGKWHVGNKQREWWPDHRGFDQFYGTPAGGGLYFYPSQFYDRPVYWNGEEQTPDSTWYSTDAFTDYSIDYIKNRRDKGKPFFMYLAYVAPHFPLQAKMEDIDKYRDTYKVGYDVIRKARFKKQKQLGIASADLPASEPVYGDWETVENKNNEALKMAVYAAMVDCLDQNIGKLMSTLADEHIDKNTVVMFLSDNGACQTSWNKTPEARLGSRDCNAAYGTWYNVSNTPYRMRKSQEHEGGIITPLIMHWPEGLKGRGVRISEPAHITDIMPTCLDIAEAKYPVSYKNKVLDPLDGRSFMPLTRGIEQDKDRAYFWEHEGNRAVRVGDWKLVSLHKKDWELYNLKADPYEMDNLVESHPDEKNELLKKYKIWADEHGVQRWPLKR
ncbi:arylsulfatase [Labilibaculum antarcticum]|uniref:Arylsulfatase n=1 Tax=Labilibaculum antarcticum TaxID=1717717 RepID=A0A1Y1CHN4_9BACT|nr:arylsulfatase [Labilibaculum antarcticum]BAX78801.1 arylsulfatase [Labilibaculum antarcticum]